MATGTNAVDLGHQLLDVPFSQMIKSMGLAIAQAQYELDLVGIRLAQLMAGQDQSGDDAAPVSVKVKFGTETLSLLELGFTPTFYQFVDTIIEIKMSVSMSTETSSGGGNREVSISGKGSLFFGIFGKVKANAASVSASYASKYQYSAEGSSLMRTKLVPIPPPAVLEERIRRLLDASKTGS
jgi:hypothetical protein